MTLAKEKRLARKTEKENAKDAGGSQFQGEKSYEATSGRISAGPSGAPPRSRSLEDKINSLGELIEEIKSEKKSIDDQMYRLAVRRWRKHIDDQLYKAKAVQLELWAISQDIPGENVVQIPNTVARPQAALEEPGDSLEDIKGIVRKDRWDDFDD